MAAEGKQAARRGERGCDPDGGGTGEEVALALGGAGT